VARKRKEGLITKGKAALRETSLEKRSVGRGEDYWKRISGGTIREKSRTFGKKTNGEWGFVLSALGKGPNGRWKETTTRPGGGEDPIYWGGAVSERKRGGREKSERDPL